VDAQKLLRGYLKGKGLRAPSGAKLGEMLRQLGAGKGAIEHDGKVLRLYRDKTYLTKKSSGKAFQPVAWRGESRIVIPGLGGELRFKRTRGRGIDRKLLKAGKFQVRLRSGGERLQLDAKRPRRTLKNLFQEAGVPPWEREGLPLLYCESELVWAPGLGVDAKFLSAGGAPGILPDWRPSSA
jgi:tRNA(Ile)-lysidine synthase